MLRRWSYEEVAVIFPSEDGAGMGLRFVADSSQSLFCRPMNFLIDFVHVRLCLSDVVASYKALGSQTGLLLMQAFTLEPDGSQLHKHLTCMKLHNLTKFEWLWAGWAGPWVGLGWGDGMQVWPRKYLAADQRHLCM
ncbi:hypothetical protein R1sor_004184 [Riccia sorocarpa]|uniref:Uncharacterized protein n=1 Tax=Riccia sorocarpa TaxID=122646 RepID=A0ABD3H3S8_9MARC